MQDESELFACIEEHGLKYIDKRKFDGCLWILGGAEISDAIGEIEEAFEEDDVQFTFTPGGGRATNRRAGWWTSFRYHTPEQIAEHSARFKRLCCNRTPVVCKPQGYIAVSLPRIPIAAREYILDENAPEISRRVTKVLEVEAPIEKQRLFNTVRASCGLERSGCAIQSANQRILAEIPHKTTTWENRDYIWREDQYPGSYIVFRPNDEKTTRQITEISYEEIDSCLLYLLREGKHINENELIDSLAHALHFRRVGPRVKETVSLAISDGLVQGALDTDDRKRVFYAL